VNKLDPVVLFERIIADVPADLHRNLFVTGSMAAAYHYQAQLEGKAVNTKDADLVVHPAGDTASCRKMAERLLTSGWTKTEECSPKRSPTPAGDLRAIRLYPPESHDYFIEFLNLPEDDQAEPKRWIPIELSDGWYGLPSFRFMALAAENRLTSEMGLEYAAPPMMALANLLSHPTVGNDRIQSGTMRSLLRSAKDLGRVLALARLAGRNETETWPNAWIEGLKNCFPDEWQELATRAGNGLRELLADPAALDEAHTTTENGLLSGLGVTTANLRAIGERLMVDALEPLAEIAR
jgi:hypothetical protein